HRPSDCSPAANLNARIRIRAPAEQRFFRHLAVGTMLLHQQQPVGRTSSLPCMVMRYNHVVVAHVKTCRDGGVFLKKMKGVGP
ncbi:MAG TPA: hypothetical protein VFV38_47610, partial [Ktedonobacteraceae bacterium]|nr:hypothetical protein [Ktedonobacteraceae bacterium]